MSHRGMSFEEATRQVVNLMAATGQSANAYEDELPSKDSFEAARACVNEAEQYSDYPARVGTSQNLVQEMGQIAEGGHYEPSPQEEHLFPVEILEQALVDPALMDPAFEDEAVTTQDLNLCATGLNVIPDPIDSKLYKFHEIVECAGNLELIWATFVKARYLKQDEPVALPDRALKVVYNQERGVLIDEAQNLQYVQAVPDDPRFDGVVGPRDLFIWVQNLDGREPIGYIHNGYVFRHRNT